MENTRVLSGSRYEDMYKASGLPWKYMYDNITLEPEKIDEPVFDALSNICNRIKYFFVENHGSVFIFSQDVGNGKTSWAIKLMKKYIQDYGCFYDTDCLFINVPEFLAMRKRVINAPAERESFYQLENRVKNAKLVVFDDFACGNTTDFDETYLYTIIDYRWRNNLSGIYTSNVYPVHLKKTMGERIIDRIVYDKNTVRMWIRGASRRGVSIPYEAPKTSATPCSTNAQVNAYDGKVVF